MSPLNPDLGKTGKKDMASLCGRQAFFVVVVVVLFVCGTKRKRQSWTKAKGRSNEFMMRECAREKGKQEQLVYSLCVLSLTPCPHNFIVWPLTMKNTHKKRLLHRLRFAKNKPGCQCSIQGSQIRQIWRFLRQNCSDDSTEVTEGVTSTPEIFAKKQGAT